MTLKNLFIQRNSLLNIVLEVHSLESENFPNLNLPSVSKQAMSKARQVIHSDAFLTSDIG